MIRIEHTAKELAKDITGHGAKVAAAAQRTITREALLLQTAVKRHASGRPGPRMITGDYNRSIAIRVGVLWAEVFTNKPQGRRLEYGFTGEDSLGRHYDQPPFAHFLPAALERERPFEQALEADMAAGW
jgi:hypothetical protein